MFQRRPARAVYENILGAPITVVDAKFPQSVHIENSHSSVFNVENKVTSITLLNCSDLTLNFRSVISNVELIRSPSILLLCVGQCATYNVDQSNDCEIQYFSQLNNEVQIITTNSIGCEVAVRANEESEEEEKRYLIEDAGVARSSEDSESEIPIPANVVQYKTTYRDGEFLTAKLEREGIQGYFSAN